MTETVLAKKAELEIQICLLFLDRWKKTIFFWGGGEGMGIYKMLYYLYSILFKKDY